MAAALDLRAAEGDAETVNRALHAAAESLESAARHDSPQVVERGFHLTMAAAAFHIGGYAARAYSLFEGDLQTLNLSSYETALVHLMRRHLPALRQTFMNWLSAEENSDEAVLRRLQGEHPDAMNDEFGADDVVAMALTRHFHCTIARYEHAIVSGSTNHFNRALLEFVRGEQAASECKHVPLWWSFRVARHLCDDTWKNSLRVVLPKDGGPPRWAELREEFIKMLIERETAEIDLWPSQVRAAARIVDTKDDLVVALPTSAGKTRIAELCILRALADQRRVIYVTPLRALSAQIEHGLARTFRPLGVSVTSVYGASGVATSDLETLKSAQIVVATPEKLDFAIRQEPSVIDDVGLIVLDEGHMIGFSEREIRYEMLVQRLLRRPDAAERRLACLSAVFAEGEAFDDFTAWLRSDAEGEAVRSTWRPTRQRPGHLLWKDGFGRLEIEVDAVKPFVPRFVDSQQPTGRRKKSFPSNQQEFVVAATASFRARGQTVLVYCPEKRSVEAMAEAYLDAHSQGFFNNVLTPNQATEIADATRIGTEWLGATHPVVRCLSLGIAVHHGSLPRQFLSEIEHLLRRRILPICVCSPTLAQGLDLCFGVLLFKSIYRSGDLIPAKEFANVVGRVGRAFVDLDGLYILPIFEETTTKVTRKLNAYRGLIRAAQGRKLESGVKQLVSRILDALRCRLECSSADLAEYVLNLNSSWSLPAKEGDELDTWLDVALNELDTAILGIVDTLEMPTEEVADYLDNCLKGSYWQRQLKNEQPDRQALQAKAIQGRAKWIWNKTNTQSRRAYFASGVGYKAGLEIEASLDTLRGYLAASEIALEANEIEEASRNAALAADILFQIGPFCPTETVTNLPELLKHWLSGVPMSQYVDSSAVGFLQDNVVYRLVWGVESARLHLEHVQNSTDGPPGGLLALCLTYGVSSRKAAVLMQAGLRSRVIATAAAAAIGEEIPDYKHLQAWVRKLRKGMVQGPTWKSSDEENEWARFVSRFEHRQFGSKKLRNVILKATWTSEKHPDHKASVRVSRINGTNSAVISGVSSLPLGTAPLPKKVKGDYFLGRVLSDTSTVRIAARMRK
ncbi:MAG: DEAD/DEAH box helicase [Gemmataceae bacterium]